MRFRFILFPTITLAFFTVVYICCLPELFFNINSTIINAAGDGLKNYYTALYHIKYGEGWYFSGMAYPFGELVNFTDNQPAISVPLSYIDRHLFPVHHFAVGIMNALMLVSPVIGVFFIYKILTHYDVSPAWAIGFAIMISLMSPQLDRIYGHYALSYCFVFPSIWYWTICYRKSNYHFKWLAVIVSAVVFYSFLHLYYLGMYVFFIFFTMISILIIHRTQIKMHRKELVMLGLALVIPLMVSEVFMAIANPYHDRVSVPWGFTNYRASFSSVFFTKKGLSGDIIPHWMKFGKFDSEGFAYVGFTGLFIFLFLCFRILRHIYRMRTVRIDELAVLNGSDHRAILLTALFMYLLSNAFPFYIYPFENILDFVPQLKQFRSPGRFAWVCYYVFMVFGSVLVYRYFLNFRARGKTIIAYTLVLGYTTIITFEGVSILRWNWAHSFTQRKSDLFFGYDTVNDLSESGYKISDFQAILTFPMFAAGSEKIDIDGTEKSLFWGMKFSYGTGLPLINYSMSRSGMAMSSEIVQLASNPMIRKTYPDRLPSDKPILLIVTDTLRLTSNERSISRYATRIFTSTEGFVLYLLEPEDLVAARKEIMKVITPEYLNAHIYDSTRNRTVIASFTYGMEDFGPCRYPLQKGSQVIYEGRINADPDGLAEVSYWASGNPVYFGMPGLRVTQYNTKNEQVEKVVLRGNAYFDVVKTWKLNRMKIKLRQPSNTIRVEATGNDVYYTNVMIRPVRDTVCNYDPAHKIWYVNNRPYLQGSFSE